MGSLGFYLRYGVSSFGTLVVRPPHDTDSIRLVSMAFVHSKRNHFLRSRMRNTWRVPGLYLPKLCSL